MLFMQILENAKNVQHFEMPPPLIIVFVSENEKRNGTFPKITSDACRHFWVDI